MSKEAFGDREQGRLIFRSLGRTGWAGTDGGRGKHAASAVARRCLPNPFEQGGPEEHGEREYLQSSKEAKWVAEIR